MSEFPPLVYIDLWQSKPRKWARRQQTWRWTAKSGTNFRKLATSGEGFTNKSDALAAIYLLFGHGANVYLRQPEQGQVLLRGPAQPV